MNEVIKNLDREFSHIERDIIEKFAEEEGFYDTTPDSIKESIKLERGEDYETLLKRAF